MYQHSMLLKIRQNNFEMYTVQVLSIVFALSLNISNCQSVFKKHLSLNCKCFRITAISLNYLFANLVVAWL